MPRLFALFAVCAALLCPAPVWVHVPPKPKPAAKTIPAALKPAKTTKTPPVPIAKLFGIVSGMTRADVEKAYQSAGGFSGRFQQAFLCAPPPFEINALPFLPPAPGHEWKFDVVFKADTKAKNKDDAKNDIVVSVSAPYIGYASYD